jgi:hypothetical protein
MIVAILEWADTDEGREELQEVRASIRIRDEEGAPSA